jgi:NAD(P)-dependent dehydrogenase (short-subunit alcohol dehydrogenase family)
MMRALSGSVAFVTGAGRGVGRAIALALARQGVRLAVQDITPVNLAETLTLVQAQGMEALELVGDMSKKMQAQDMIEQARETLGEVNLLVNHWSVAPETSLLAIDEWDWDRTLAINLKGYFLAIQSFGRIMSTEGEGTILNVIVPPTRYREAESYPVYEISSAGVRELTRQAAHELSPHGVHVLAVEVEREGNYPPPEDREGSVSSLAWWQRDTQIFSSAVVEICSRSSLYPAGQRMVVKQDGSIQEMEID